MAKKVPVKKQESINPKIVIKIDNSEQKIERSEFSQKVTELKNNGVKSFQVIDKEIGVKTFYNKSLFLKNYIVNYINI